MEVKIKGGIMVKLNFVFLMRREKKFVDGAFKLLLVVFIYRLILVKKCFCVLF